MDQQLDPVRLLAEALASLNAIFNLIRMLKEQGGLTDEQIIAAAEAQTGENAGLIQSLLNTLPTE